MSLPHLLSRVRAARMARAFSEKVILWVDSDEDAALKIEAARAEGRFGPNTQVHTVRWLRPGEGASISGLS